MVINSYIVCLFSTIPKMGFAVQFYMRPWTKMVFGLPWPEKPRFVFQRRLENRAWKEKYLREGTGRGHHIFKLHEYPPCISEEQKLQWLPVCYLWYIHPNSLSSWELWSASLHLCLTSPSTMTTNWILHPTSGRSPLTLFSSPHIAVQGISLQLREDTFREAANGDGEVDNKRTFKSLEKQYRNSQSLLSRQGWSGCRFSSKLQPFNTHTKRSKGTFSVNRVLRAWLPCQEERIHVKPGGSITMKKMHIRIVFFLAFHFDSSGYWKMIRR